MDIILILYVSMLKWPISDLLWTFFSNLKRSWSRMVNILLLKQTIKRLEELYVFIFVGQSMFDLLYYLVP